jgi:hypothetical protein
MLSANTYVIRPARPADRPALRRLAFLASADALSGRILVGEIDRVVAAAISLDEGRIVSDGLAHAGLRVRLRMRAAALGAHASRPSVQNRIPLAQQRGEAR